VPESVVVALVGLVGTVTTAAATVAAAYARAVGRRIGTPNGGHRDIASHLDALGRRVEELHALIVEHVRADDLRFETIRARMQIVEEKR
jgi:hypothetical protein